MIKLLRIAINSSPDSLSGKNMIVRIGTGFSQRTQREKVGADLDVCPFLLHPSTPLRVRQKDNQNRDRYKGISQKYFAGL